MKSDVVFKYKFQISGLLLSFDIFSISGPPSPPRHIRRRVVGAFGFKRQYQIFWSASNNTGGSPVNYTVKLCLNDSLQNQSENNICKNSSSSACRPTNILSTNKEFYCILRKDYDFSTNCAEFCNYTICVVASNDVGSSESCVPAPYVNDIASGKKFTSQLKVCIPVHVISLHN